MLADGPQNFNSGAFPYALSDGLVQKSDRQFCLNGSCDLRLPPPAIERKESGSASSHGSLGSHTSERFLEASSAPWQPSVPSRGDSNSPSHSENSSGSINSGEQTPEAHFFGHSPQFLPGGMMYMPAHGHSHGFVMQGPPPPGTWGLAPPWNGSPPSLNQKF